MNRFIEKYKKKTYDIIVIGGGITGAAVAYDAASRGLSVALVEKNDFGSATSAATSKLIHGGLRYLANMEFGLVRESLRERRILENIAPNFVHPIPNIIACYNRGFKSNKWVIRAGMILYDILSFDKGSTWDKNKAIPCHRALSREKLISLEPRVKRTGLTGGSLYYDCVSIFPERLTLAFIKSAVSCGAEAANYAETTGFFIQNGRVTGVRVLDRVKNNEIEISGNLIINCGGPWADMILGLAKKESHPERIRRSEGIHIITEKLLNGHMLSSMTPAGRHLFMIPWRNHTLIGTTDKEYIGSPDDWRVTEQSLREIISDVNATFGDGKLIEFGDIKHAYGGLRPLVEEDTKEVYKSSRKYEIYDNAGDGLEGLITVEGGKYTTSRNLAQNVMKMAEKKIGRRLPKTVTDRRHLHGSEIKNINEFRARIKSANSSFSEKTLDCLSGNYGTEALAVLEIAKKDKALSETRNEDGEILAQVVYAVRNEMAVTLNDIILRRTGFGTLGYPGDELVKKIAAVAAKILGWNESKIKTEIGCAKRALKIPGK